MPLRTLLTCASLLACGLPAQAAEWTLTFSATGPIWSGDGRYPMPELTLNVVTEDTLSLSTASGSLGEGYRILSFSGTRNGRAISAVLSAGDDPFFSFGLDSYLYATTPEKVSFQGLGYTVGRQKFNLYGSTTDMGGGPETQWFEMSNLPSTNPSSPYATFTGQLALTPAVPEPAGWALMAAGTALLAGVRARRRPAA